MTRISEEAGNESPIAVEKAERHTCRQQ